MKFKNYLEGITGIGIYPLASLLIFGLFFVAVTIYVYGSPKQKMQAKGHIPLG